MDIYRHTESLGHLSGLASRLFNKLLSNRFRAVGIDMTAEQWGVILLLLNSEALTQSDIGEQLYLEKSSVSRSIAGLERKGWIERKKTATDSRLKVVSLTTKAIAIAERCADIAASVLADAQQGLTENEKTKNRVHIDTVIKNLRALNGDYSG